MEVVSSRFVSRGSCEVRGRQARRLLRIRDDVIGSQHHVAALGYLRQLPVSGAGSGCIAYALALVSLHKKALDGLARARTLAGRNNAPPAPAWVELIESTRPEGQGNIEFFAGWFLWKHGRHEEGRAFLERCRKSPHTMEWFRLIANDALRGLQGRAEPTPVDPRAAS